MDDNRRILVVDDQDEIRVQVARILEKPATGNSATSLIEQIRSRIGKGSTSDSGKPPPISYQVDTAGQGRDAYERVKDSFTRHQPYSVIFMDLRMPPGWDGLETAQRIRAIDKEVQIVLMSAYADHDQSELAERIGEPDKLLYIKKPFQAEEIRQFALALSEKWNLNRREKDRLILTNRLMRENTFLTRHGHGTLEQASKAILTSFMSFLEARAGVLRRQSLGGWETLASSDNDEAATLPRRLPTGWLDDPRLLSQDKDGTCFVPLLCEGFRGHLLLSGKGLVFNDEQLRPFIEILAETAREVVINALLLQASRDQRTLAEVSQMAARLAARLREALAPGELALSQLQGEAQAREQAAATLSRTLRRLHDWATMIEHYGQALLPSQPGSVVRLTDLLAQLQNEFAGTLSRAQITWRSEVSSELTVHADPLALRLCLRQLVVNALEALEQRPAGAPRQLSFQAQATGEQVTLRLRDTGGGLPEEVAAHLFEPFMSHGKASGAGLGAAIARQIAERHQGRLTCESEPGVGTTFILVLPRKAVG